MDRRGYTLVEMMIATVIGVFTILLLGGLFIKGLERSGGLKTEANIQQRTRKTIERMAAEIKRTSLASLNVISTSSISFELPVLQVTTGDCSAHAVNPSSTSPAACASGNVSDCVNACGGFSAHWNCVNRVCKKRYTYALSTASGISQLMSTAPGENDRIIGSGIQSITFQKNGVSPNDPNLRGNEVRIRATAQETSDFEKRLRQDTLSAVVQVRNP
jgi:prepilin-type N-terminal cleavage/methylation domain-containing protein